jgi:hypothetical protein
MYISCFWKAEEDLLKKVFNITDKEFNLWVTTILLAHLLLKDRMIPSAYN